MDLDTLFCLSELTLQSWMLLSMLDSQPFRVFIYTYLIDLAVRFYWYFWV